MLKRRSLSFILSILLLTGLCACAVPEPKGDYTFTDSLGREVSLPTRPQTVAVLFSSLADVWTTAGGSIAVTVGESVERGFAEESVILVDSGSGHTTIDTETLLTAKPDLIIGTADYPCQVETVEFTSSVGIPSACFRLESFDDYLAVLRIFTDLTEQSERYETYGTKVQQEITNCLQAVQGKTPHYEKILFIRAGSSAKSTKAKNSTDNFACAMLAELGTQNIADQTTVLTDSLSLEAILLANPDYIFLTTMGTESVAKAYIADLFASEGWNALQAVQKQNYQFLPKDLFHFKPNGRWAEAYDYLYKILYTE